MRQVMLMVCSHSLPEMVSLTSAFVHADRKHRHVPLRQLRDELLADLFGLDEAVLEVRVGPGLLDLSVEGRADLGELLMQDGWLFDAAHAGSSSGSS